MKFVLMEHHLMRMDLVLNLNVVQIIISWMNLGNILKNGWIIILFRPDFFTLMDEISLHTYDKLTDDEIRNFEDEFEVKCRGYSISCYSKDVEYKFS